MNKRRREKLMKASSHIDMAFDIISGAREEEENCLSSMPDNLQDSDQCSKMEDAIYELEEAERLIDEINDCISKAMD